ncbi:MAG: DUF882 domain-containing protein [Polyangiaceae bacterium]|nr:DUF882 domain-containing protein [Polyangiaceae bacterium]
MIFRPTPLSCPLFVCVSLALTLLLVSTTTAAEQRVHVVASGHTLGKIAKRYRVTVEELCKANAIPRNVRLTIGQRIVIPDDLPADPSRPAPRASPKRRAAQPDDLSSRDFTTHRVAVGHTLAKIAKVYLSQVDAIRESNGLRPRARLRVGQCLKIPLSPGSPSHLRTRRLPCLSEGLDTNRVDSDRLPAKVFATAPDKPGVVRLIRGNRSWSGRLLDRGGTVLPDVIEKVDQLLFDRNSGETHSTDPRLLELLVQVSDHFGGRSVHVVSGYREESSNLYTTRSNHALGRAIDITIPGVPNRVLRDFCQRFEGAGVGYYPNSSFVHLDVRSVTTHWTDVSGPGEAPRYTSVRSPMANRGVARAQRSPDAARSD